VSEENKDLEVKEVPAEDVSVENISAEELETLTEAADKMTDEMAAKNAKKSKSIGKRIADSFRSRAFKSGGYSTIIVTAVIILAVLVNLFVEKLNIQVDMSTEGLYTISEETEKIVGALKDDIKIYYVAAEGYEDSILSEILKNYDALSDRITVKTIDPALHPKFVSNYSEADEGNTNCVIVENTKTQTSKFIDYNDMIKASLDYTTYSQQVTDIDMEGQITSAIQFVTTEDVPKIYQVSGHGEMELCSALEVSIDKLNVELDTLSTLTNESIPEDCKMLLIVGPTTDYTEEEVNMIEEYLKNGGSAAIFTNYTTESMTNFESLLAYYGISMVNGYVVEQAGNCMAGNPLYAVPETGSTHDVLASIENTNAFLVFPFSKGLKQEQVRDTIEYTNVLSTSDGAYTKQSSKIETFAKEDGDIEGPFELGIIAEETYNDTTTKLAVYGSSLALDENMVATAQLGNSDLLMDTINWMVEHETGLNIPTKNVQLKYVTVPQAQGVFWVVTLAIIVPVLLLVAGFLVYFRRRKA